MRNKLPVLCYSTSAHGFAYWSHPEDWLGWDGLLISTADNNWDRDQLAPYFKSIEHVDTFPMTRGGTPFRPVTVWRCVDQVRPYPFRNTGQ